MILTVIQKIPQQVRYDTAKWLVIIFISLLGKLFLPNDLLAQITNNEKINTDSTHNEIKKEFKLPTVEVFETRSKSNSAINFSPNKIINKEDIQLVSPMQLSEVLNFSPGVSIRNYGGLGAMKTISIRGTGSMRSLILLDGMPLNSSQNGSFDLNNIAVSMIDNIEIVRGGSSAIFGGNAIGGAVNIRTNFSPTEKFLANFSYGSFGETTLNMIGNLTFDNSSQNSSIDYFSVSADFQRADGDFPFEFNQFGQNNKFKRENADYLNAVFSVSGKGNISNWSIWSRGIFSKTDKGVPGAILQGTVNQSNARWEEENYILLASANRAFADNSGLAISGIFKRSNTLFKEFSMGVLPEYKYLLNDFGLTVRHHFIGFGWLNEIVGTASYGSLSGDMLSKNLGSFVDRISFALGYRIEKDFKFSNQILMLNAGLRMDNNFENVSKSVENANQKTAFSGTFGGIYNIENFPIKFRTNISHNFRFPNFNEMYYRFYGTENLLPEKSNNLNLGFFFDLLNLFAVNVDGFHIDTRDMIISVPTSPMTWQAMNLARAASNGLELSISLLREMKFISNLNFSYTLQSTVDRSPNSITHNKQLPYIPQETFNFLFCLRFCEIDFGMKGEYSSFRYIQDDNSLNAILPKYFTSDIFLCRKFCIDAKSDIFLTFRLECKNIFADRYEIVSNYIMPGRQFRASIGLEF